MAITYVGGTSDWERDNAASLTLSFGSISYQANDVALILAKSQEGGTIPVLALSGVSGWTEIRNDNDDAGVDRVHYLWYKKLGASESDVTVTTTVGTTYDHTALMMVFRGVDTTTQLDATTTHTSGANDRTPDNATIDTVTANAAVVIFCGMTSAGADVVMVAPSGYTLGPNVDSNDNTDTHLPTAGAYLLDVGAAGTETPGAWLNTGTEFTADWTTYAIALRPLASAAIAPAAGALALTGAAPSLLGNRTIGPLVGALALTGNTPSISTFVRLLDSVSSTTTPSYTPIAGINRVAYIGVGTADTVNGAYAPTALTYGGQSCTLIGTAKAFRQGISITVFRLLESGIAAMVGNSIIQTWGDVNGQPATAVYFIGIYDNVNQAGPNGTVQQLSIDLVQSTWAPGSLTKADDGMGVGFFMRGSGNTAVFDAPWVNDETVNPTGAVGKLGHNSYTSEGTDAVTMTFGIADNPDTLVMFVIMPSTSSVNTIIEVPSGPWR